MNQDKQSLFNHQGFDFALFDRTGGYTPELDHQDNLAIMGRTLARLHLVGETHRFQHRPALTVDSHGWEAISYVANHFIPFEHRSQYQQVSDAIMACIVPSMAEVDLMAVHGDLHVGNILMRDDIPYLVDFDDARLAPAIQDIWMLLSGSQQERSSQLQKIIPAYEEFRPFPHHELKLITALQTLRMIHHTAWLARRWDDPAFPPAFPWFNSQSFWQQHLADLQQQLHALQTGPTDNH